MSFASIISIVVLLAAYGYSVPLEGKWQTPTVPTTQWEFTTGKTIVDNKDTITAHLMNSEESANVPKVIIPREFMNKFEWSTPATSESRERDLTGPKVSREFMGKSEWSTPATSESRDSRESPMFSDKLVRSSPFTPTVESPSSNLIPRLFDETKFLDSTTWRSSNSAEEKVMPKRVFKNVVDKSTSAEVFATTPVFKGESKEATSAERVNVLSEETSTKMSSGSKRPVKSTSSEVDRSSEESKVREPTKVTPRLPIKGKKPIDI